MAPDFRLDFVGVGASRSGTTWLARCLVEHPQIWVPPVKELHYFDNDTRFEPSLAELRAAFREAPPDLLLGEFTPRYLIRREALERIAAAFPETKILVCLRDPVQRAYSQYCYFRYNMRKEPETVFARALDGFYREDYVVKSRYAGALRGLYELFDRDRVHVTIYDDVTTRPGPLLRELFAFLGVDPAFEPRSAEATINASRRAAAAPTVAGARFVRWLTYSDALPARATRRAFGGRVPALLAGPGLVGRNGSGLDAATRSEVYGRYFARDVEETERLLGRDLSAWKPATR